MLCSLDRFHLDQLVSSDHRDTQQNTYDGMWKCGCMSQIWREDLKKREATEVEACMLWNGDSLLVDDDYGD